MQLTLRCSLGAVLLTCTLGAAALVSAVPASPALFFTPSGDRVPEVLDAINGAKTRIHMMMYHLTQDSVMNALIAAKNRGVEVQVLLDDGLVSKEKSYGAWHTLTAAGVSVIKSSSGPTGFSLSHLKAFVVDDTTAYIMTLNLTKITSSTRDVGYVTSEPTTIQFFETLFTTDRENASAHTALSPTVIPDNIVLAPVNARERLVNLLNSATTLAQVEVENLSDDTIINTLIQAHTRGVRVEVLLPRCNLSSADFDMPAARKLAAANIDVRLMPDPSTADTPYIHQKSMTIDGQRVFLGSENFSFNSLDHGRELGVIFSETAKVRQLSEVFAADFAKGLSLTQAEGVVCPKRTFSESDEDLARD